MPDKNEVEMKGSDIVMKFALSSGGKRMTLIEGDNFFMITIEAFKSCQASQVKSLTFTPAGKMLLGKPGEEKEFNVFTSESAGHTIDLEYEANVLEIENKIKRLTL